MTPQSCVEKLLRQVHDVVCTAQGFFELQGEKELQEKRVLLDGCCDQAKETHRQLCRLVVGDSDDGEGMREQSKELVGQLGGLAAWCEERGMGVMRLRERCRGYLDPSAQDHQQYNEAHLAAILEFARRKAQADRACERLRQSSWKLPEPAIVADVNTDKVQDEVEIARKPSDAKQGMTCEQANMKAMKLAERDKEAFFELSQNQQAKQIGCHNKTWTNTPFYKTCVKKGLIRPQESNTKRCRRTPPPAVGFSKAVEAATSVGKGSVLDELIAREDKEAIERLTKEQQADEASDNKGRNRKRA